MLLLLLQTELRFTVITEYMHERNITNEQPRSPNMEHGQ